MKPIKDGKSVSKVTESTAKWNPSVKSHRGTAKSLGADVAKVNPLAPSRNATARARTIPQPVAVTAGMKKSNVVVHKAPIARGRGQGKVGGGLYPKVAPSNSPKNKV